MGFKGYKLLDIQMHRFFISRHVIFLEYNFPLAKHSPNQSITDLFLGKILLIPIIPSMYHNTSLQSNIDQLINNSMEHPNNLCSQQLQEPSTDD